MRPHQLFLLCVGAWSTARCDSDPAPNSTPTDAAVAPDAAPRDATPLGDGAATRPTMGGSASRNPCGAVTSAGRCRSTRELQFCAQPTGRGEPRLVTETCLEGEECRATASGAECVQTAECLPDAAECAADGQLRRCVSGRWMTQACATRCVESVSGAACAPMATTRTAMGRVRFQVRTPNADRSDWGAPTLEANEGMVVLSQRGDMVIGSAVTDNEGRFAITVPTEPMDGDRLVIAAADFREGEIVVAAGNPNYPPSTMDRDETAAPPSGSRVWSWSWPVAMLPASDPYDLTVETADGAGAAEAFAWLRATYRRARQIHTGMRGHSFIAWVGMGVSWACGACYNRVNATIGRTRFASQLWLDGSAQNEGYWSSGVTVHEAGHWWMDAFGYSPGEGGPHTLGVETFPGQAWSEGFASFVAGDQRNDPVYVDKQGGGMFWFDMARAVARDANAMMDRQLLTPNADAQEGTQQFLDENYVSAILWRLRGTDAAPLYRALASDRATRAPFGGCYQRHQWTGVGSMATRICNTTESVPMLADFLDALNCASFDRNQLRMAIGDYPYAVERPFCRAGVEPDNCYGYGYPVCASERADAPLTITFSPRDGAPPWPVRGALPMRAQLVQRGPLPDPIAVELVLPPGVTRTDGPTRFSVTPGRPGTTHTIDIDLAAAQVPSRDAVLRVDVRGAAFGFHAAVPHRFGRAVVLPTAVNADTRTLRIGRHDLGAPVPMGAALVRVPGATTGSSVTR